MMPTDEQPPLERPRLKRTVESLDTPDGDILLTRFSAEDVRIVRPSESERELLGALDGRRSMTDLVARFDADLVGGTIARMRELLLLEDAADDDAVPAAERDRFDRQLRYFSEVSQGGLAPSECQQRLRESRVAVLGVGGLGGRVALELACCGVGELRLVDGDLVETSNLDRQIQYDEADVGQRKVDATAARIRCFNSAIHVEAIDRKVESEGALAECIVDADIVIAAADWPPYEIEHWFNSACFAAGIPYIAMGQTPPIVRVGPLYVPGKTGCFACQEIRHKREYPLYEAAVEQRRAKSSPVATLGPPCGVIGGLIGMEVAHHLTGLVEPATLGASYSIDLRTMDVERNSILAEPGCPVCADLQPAPQP